MTPLTHNATILSESAGRRVLDIRGKWINWLDDQTWKPIDCSFREVGQRWECRTGPLTVSVPPRADGVCHIVSSNRWDVFAKTRISDADFALHVRPVGVSLVDAVMESPTSIVFPGAYPFGDLVYRMNFGRAPRLEKLVRINSKPAGTDDLRISFVLNHDAANVVAFDRNLSAAERDDYEQIGRDLQAKLADNRSRVQDIMVENFRQRALRIATWDGSLKNARATALGFAANQASGRRGVGIKPAFAWDSATPRQRMPIMLEIERQPNGNVRLTKVVPRAFLESATYPVLTDTTTTFYPDADTETTSVDGLVYRLVTVAANQTWANLRSGAGTNVFDTDANNSFFEFLCSTTSARYREILRGIMLFDTSAIGSGSTVNSATQSIYGIDNSGTSSATPDVNVYSSTPASNTSLATSDYGQTGTTAYSTAITNAAFTLSAYNDFAFNATGLAAVSLTGITKTSVKNANYDVANSAPTWGSGQFFSMQCSYADQTGTSQDPKLMVDYTVAASGSLFPPRQSIPPAILCF